VACIQLEERKTVTADWYTTVCLPQMLKKWCEKRPKAGTRGMLLHHDNVSSHQSIKTREFFELKSIKTLPHPSYSPDLAPCDFFLFPLIKKDMRGTRFSSPEDAVEAYIELIEALDKNQWSSCFEKWFQRMDKCIEAKGCYFEKL
jgi:[histone H3]-lysine36 N-dimethyltransferase SETMAR